MARMLEIGTADLIPEQTAPWTPAANGYDTVEVPNAAVIARWDGCVIPSRAMSARLIDWTDFGIFCFFSAFLSPCLLPFLDEGQVGGGRPVRASGL